MGAGNLTAEETECIRADLKLIKTAATDGFNITFYVFLREKKCFMATLVTFILFSKCRATSYNNNTF